MWEEVVDGEFEDDEDERPVSSTGTERPHGEDPGPVASPRLRFNSLKA